MKNKIVIADHDNAGSGSETSITIVHPLAGLCKARHTERLRDLAGQMFDLLNGLEIQGG